MAFIIRLLSGPLDHSPERLYRQEHDGRYGGVGDDRCKRVAEQGIGEQLRDVVADMAGHEDASGRASRKEGGVEEPGPPTQQNADSQQE